MCGAWCRSVRRQARQSSQQPKAKLARRVGLVGAEAGAGAVAEEGEEAKR